MSHRVVEYHSVHYYTLLQYTLRNVKVGREVVQVQIQAQVFFFMKPRSSGNRETHSSVATMRGIPGRFDASVARFR